MTKPVVPPQNLEAEEHTLGAMMLTPAAVSTVAEMLTPADFYRDSHGTIFAAAVALAERGEPVDPITLSQELTDRGDLARAGGRVRVHEIARLVPASVNVAHYARIVRETATLRGLIHAGGEIAGYGWDGSEETPRLVEQAMELVYGLADHDDRHGEGLVEAGPAIRDAFDRTRELAEKGSEVVGVASGFPSLDRLTAGFHPANLVVAAGRPSMGKAQPLDATILTPEGWKTMGQIEIGDVIIGADGQHHPVLGIHPRGVLQTYRVTLEDGATVECCGDHLWTTTTRNERRREAAPQQRSTDEIASTLRRPDGYGWNHAIPWMEPAQLAGRGEMPIHPWLLGFYLAEGDYSTPPVRLTNPELDLEGRVRAALPESDELRSTGMSLRVCGRVHTERSATAHALDELGLRGLRSHEKFIPEAYLYSRPEVRLALLRGLCDGDGYTDGKQGRSVEISTSSARLAEGIAWLVGSLGGRCTRRTRPAVAVTGTVRKVSEHPSHRLTVSFPGSGLCPVSSQKHLSRWRPGRQRQALRFITGIAPAREVECRCLTVAGDHYVTDGFAVTHNSAFALGVVAHLILGSNPLPVAVFTMEMSPLEVVQRLQSLAGHIDSTKLRTGVGLNSEDWNRLATASGQLDQGHLYLDSAPVLTVSEIRARARRLKIRRPSLALIVVDYLQLMDASRQDRSRVQEVSEISRGLKQVAVELNVPVLALSQLSRNVEARHDKRPMLADLRESGSIEQDADVVLFLYRDEYYNPDTAEEDGTAGIAEVNIAKQRNGPTGTVKLSFVKRFARFSELPLPGVSS